MKCYKKTHQVSMPVFILVFVSLMVLTAMLSGCSSDQVPVNPTDEPVISAPAETPVEDTNPIADPVDTEPVEEDIQNIETPTASQTSSKTTVPGLPNATIADDTVIETGNETVYNFKTEAFAGCGLDGTVRDYELYYGIYAKTDGSNLIHRAYSYDGNVTPVKAMFMRNSSRNYFNLDIDYTDKSVDLSPQANDAFTLFVVFSNDKACLMTIYVNDGKPYLVERTEKSADYVRRNILPRQAEILELTEQFGITPENTGKDTLEDIFYPYWNGGDVSMSDTELWRELAHDIIGNDDTLPDSLKATMLHDWMTANLSYDKYIVAKHNGKSRVAIHQSNDWSVYRIHTGICRDFVNIYTIMCRELDIPCTSISNSSRNHGWSLVYLNGKWIEIDLTKDIQRKVYKEDVTDVSNADKTVCYNTFLNHWTSGKFDDNVTVGKDIYTRENFARK